MMKKSKPIALWKSIVGATLSSFAFLTYLGLLIATYFALIKEGMPLWVWAIFMALILVSLILLILNIDNLIKTIKYKKEQKRSNAVADSNKKELLHKLLEEGKITIEEYDELMKK